MSRFSAVLPPLEADKSGSIDQISLGAEVVRRAIALRRLLSRQIALALDYAETMQELESLDDEDLRDLRLNRADFRDIAWAEAWRRYRGHQQRMSSR